MITAVGVPDECSNGIIDKRTVREDRKPHAVFDYTADQFRQVLSAEWLAPYETDIHDRGTAQFGKEYQPLISGKLAVMHFLVVEKIAVGTLEIAAAGDLDIYAARGTHEGR